MSKSPLRKDKTCLNCRHVVDQRYCPNCGQENTDTRKTFHHLFIHFFEDLTHYENAFWKTIKNLLFRPSSLTKEYLSGKRLSYLAPVRLYIFISFVTFFLVAVLPNASENLVNINQTKTTSTVENNKVKIDTIGNKTIGLKELLSKGDAADSLDNNKNKEEDHFINMGYKSVKELDSLQKYGKKKDRLDPVEYWITRKIQNVNDHNTRAEIVEKLFESASHNFPKVLLIYMPLFAFFLWLFHGKKRWYYFDHGIFTLHYFSFLLLIYLIMFLSSSTLSLFGEARIIIIIKGIVRFIGSIWMFYYFFPAHHRFYGETRWISFFKSITLFFINMIFIIIILALFFIYTLINIH
ncbi:DUF3667 domain-containing protein [Flavobacterium sp. N1994]|uniref:DUF3667 domain-containing protein n=1 Tax=Flavobacterium sp. N1994 TaxID=2986827 RepID=UPI0022228442|nr:DUF3667 domain-containing protein [Flavobacterium sp. N1994]